jgi:hypothetical protein
MLSPIPSSSLARLCQLLNKMENILLVALENYSNTFVETIRTLDSAILFMYLLSDCRFCEKNLIFTTQCDSLTFISP